MQNICKQLPLEMQLCGLQSYLEGSEKNSYGLAPHTIVEPFVWIQISGIVFFPVKPLGPFEHVKWGKKQMVQILSTRVLRCSILWDEKEMFRFGLKIFFCYGYSFFHIQRTWWRNFYFMLYIKSSKRVQKAFPPSTLCMKKLISITMKYFISALQTCKKLLSKQVKTCDKSEKPRYTAVATSFAN